jgi:hypothetical protein
VVWFLCVPLCEKVETVEDIFSQAIADLFTPGIVTSSRCVYDMNSDGQRLRSNHMVSIEATLHIDQFEMVSALTFDEYTMPDDYSGTNMGATAEPASVFKAIPLPFETGLLLFWALDHGNDRPKRRNGHTEQDLGPRR